MSGGSRLTDEAIFFSDSESVVGVAGEECVGVLVVEVSGVVESAWGFSRLEKSTAEDGGGM